MMTWLWILIGVVAAGMIWEFLLICPDKVPWRRKKKPDQSE